MDKNQLTYTMYGQHVHFQKIAIPGQNVSYIVGDLAGLLGRCGSLIVHAGGWVPRNPISTCSKSTLAVPRPSHQKETGWWEGRLEQVYDNVVSFL